MFDSSLFLWIIIFSTLGSIGAIGGAALLLLFPDSTRKRLLPCLLSYATGTLLGAAFLGMIPKAMAKAQPLNISITILAGIVLFFLLEKILLWRHCHNEGCEVHSSTGAIILIGDAFHNFVDGLVITAAFLTSIPMGIVTSLAVIAHEIPQEVGDFAILLHSGYSKLRALVLNFLSSLTTLLGAMVAYYFLAETSKFVPYILAMSAASFIYIAVADLVPSLHKSTGLKATVLQITLILSGIFTIAFFQFYWY
jgi:zinc and cadmium transporter